MWDEASQAWGSLCAPTWTFPNGGEGDVDEYWSEVAVLACRQLGLPSAGTVLVNPASKRYPWKTHKVAAAAPAKAFLRHNYRPCSDSMDHPAEALGDCSGLVIAEGTYEDCRTAGGVVNFDRSAMPVAVACRAERRISSPPSPPPPAKYSNLTVRLVNPKTGLTHYHDGTPKYRDDWSPFLSYLFPSADDLQATLDYCTTKGHAIDAWISCRRDTPRDMSPPPPAAKPTILNDIEISVESPYENVHLVRFGARPAGAPSTEPLMWGSACAEDSWSGISKMRLLGHTLCNQITNGVKPYGVWWHSQGDPPFVGINMDELQRRPVVLSDLDCSKYGGPASEAAVVAAGSGASWTNPELVAVPRNISYCKAGSCGDDYYYPTDMIDVRLVGGSDKTWGRLEVLNRNKLRNSPEWGTVCASAFTVHHAQAICRDLGLPWEGASLLPSAAVAPADPAAWILDEITCYTSSNDPAVHRLGKADRLSFVRDCNDARTTAFPICDSHGTDVVMACGGELWGGSETEAGAA
ncbi:hypothetical protein HYH03_007527 [Edaphochlamys debaryana]|uniref:SRCR domain-containing protein n=1 Tax=Edaphochlamys debaryana TaxID=47281 RepID=A0A835Y226_9CHLO|nr:hypothetical protein HYH03_007527 [Edaphochlamys debaryana]|eukprot:KAG2494475.1 hypothetical protein HYH03_007527 [Edaphochlamys debaryana]